MEKRTDGWMHRWMDGWGRREEKYLLLEEFLLVQE